MICPSCYRDMSGPHCRPVDAAEAREMVREYGSHKSALAAAERRAVEAEKAVGAVVVPVAVAMPEKKSNSAVPKSAGDSSPRRPAPSWSEPATARITKRDDAQGAPAAGSPTHVSPELSRAQELPSEPEPDPRPGGVWRWLWIPNGMTVMFRNLEKQREYSKASAKRRRLKEKQT